MKKNNLSLFAVLTILVVILTNCNKQNGYPVIVPPGQASFTNQTIATYYVKNDPNTSYKIPIGITGVSSANRTVNVTVTSSTGAAAGTQYTLPSTTVTIPAGKVVDSLIVKGIFAGYSSTRVDTLTFTISGGDAPVSDFNTVFKLVMRRYCDVVSTSLTGNYASSRDYEASLTGQVSAAKYTAVISDWTAVTATTATVKIKNLLTTADVGFGGLYTASDPVVTGLTATLDWTDPANFKVTIATQPYINSLLTYGASTITGTGSFSSCDQTFTISCVIRVSAGSFGTQIATLLR